MRGGTNSSFGIEVAELAGVNKLLTENAREILKKLENKDVSKNDTKKAIEVVDNKTKHSEVERIIKDIDVNNLTPMQAFNVLVDLKEKLN